MPLLQAMEETCGDIDSIDILKIILILREIQDKVRPFSAQYGTRNFVSKYRIIPFFKGWLATLSNIEVRSIQGCIRHARGYFPRCLAREDIACDVDEVM